MSASASQDPPLITIPHGPHLCLSSATITDRLPIETLTEIIVALPKTDQLTLCRVSQLWSELCLSVINRAVVLGDFATAKTLLEGILAKPGRAGAIRSFAVKGNVAFLYLHPDKEFTALLVNTIELTIPQLQHLSVPPDLLGVGYPIALQKCTFPSLTSYTFPPCTHPYPIDVFLAFLEHHPGLTYVRISVSDPPSSLRVHLPNLQRFYGKASLVPALVTPQLREARLYWSGLEDIERTVIALGSITSPHTPFSSINNAMETHRQCSPFVEALATHIPNLKTLHMRSATDWGSPERETLDHLTMQLPRFKTLSYLALEDALSEINADKTSRSVRDRMHAVALTWGSVCPTLEACCIHEYAFRRKDDGVWEYCTRTEFNDLTGALWYY
ncbi:hypothetical protein B0H12DRAFT_1097302 [Mycena haematopus]|nr:hypothetical protein B0H12DRAFT_1097302 [Mycena haematopus]